MKIAVVSFDINFAENLVNLLKNNVSVYGDSLSLIKDGLNNKPDVIIYDSSSGIFAEDDLKYLIGKFGLKDIKYYVLKVPENPINSRNFSDDIEFINKDEALNILPNLLNVKEEHVVVNETSLPEKETYNTQINEPTEISSSEISENNLIKDIDFEYGTLGSQEIKDEEIYNIEPTNIETSFDYDFNISSENSANLDLEFNNLDLESEIKSTKYEGKHTNKEKDFLDLEFNNPDLESELKQIESKILQPSYNSFKEEKLENKNNEVPESNLTFNKKSLEEFVKNDIIENEQKEDEKIMVANFNIQISSEDIKKLALEIVRDMVKNDQAMQTIIDHLQIDFQDEARRELENLKNEIKASLRKEAENVMRKEIERMIKEELKDYVAEITAKIVKEKLDQAFRNF